MMPRRLPDAPAAADAAHFILMPPLMRYSPLTRVLPSFYLLTSAFDRPPPRRDVCRRRL